MLGLLSCIYAIFLCYLQFDDITDYWESNYLNIILHVCCIACIAMCYSVNKLIACVLTMCYMIYLSYLNNWHGTLYQHLPELGYQSWFSWDLTGTLYQYLPKLGYPNFNVTGALNRYLPKLGYQSFFSCNVTGTLYEYGTGLQNVGGLSAFERNLPDFAKPMIPLLFFVIVMLSMAFIYFMAGMAWEYRYKIGRCIWNILYYICQRIWYIIIRPALCLLGKFLRWIWSKVHRPYESKSEDGAKGESEDKAEGGRKKHKTRGLKTQLYNILLNSKANAAADVLEKLGYSKQLIEMTRKCPTDSTWVWFTLNEMLTLDPQGFSMAYKSLQKCEPLCNMSKAEIERLHAEYGWESSSFSLMKHQSELYDLMIAVAKARKWDIPELGEDKKSACVMFLKTVIMQTEHKLSAHPTIGSVV